MPLPLRTERLILRDFEEADWEAVHIYACDPEVLRYMTWGSNSEDDTRAFIARKLEGQRQEPRTTYDLAVVLASEARLIGSCGLVVSRPETGQGWIGYCYHRDYWGRGFATEAARVIVDFGFEELGMHRIFATCDVENVGSARVMEKLGMRREGHFLQNEWVRGRWRDTYLYAILVEEWRARGRRGEGA